MILYIFNGYYPDNSGFGKRCKKEIEILSKKDSVVVLCRGNNKSSKKITLGKHSFLLENFNVHAQLIERTTDYKSGMYEIIRNLDLLHGLSTKLFQLLWRMRREKIQLYVVNSPLTVSAIAYVLAKVYKQDPSILEFHDLEPELAKDIKKIDDTNIVMKITYYLEKKLSNAYRHIIVTSESQAKKLQQRTNVIKNKLIIIPNSINYIEEKEKINKATLYKKYALHKNDFIMVYAGNLSYDYTIVGMVDLLKKLPNLIKEYAEIKLVIIGDGEGKKLLQSIVTKQALQKQVIFTGRIAHPSDFLQIAHVGLIPWKKNEMTNTILPTKLFEYMAHKNVIIAPNFGEFSKILNHQKNALLYNSIDELLEEILSLAKNPSQQKELQQASYELYKKKFASSIYEKQLIQLL